MNAVRIAAIALIMAGVLGLVYGSFSYTKEINEANLGPIELSVLEVRSADQIKCNSIASLLAYMVNFFVCARKLQPQTF